MGRAQFQNHLLLGAEIQRLDMTTATQIPDVQLMAVFTGEQKLRLEPGLNHFRRAPFTADHGIQSQVPPEIVMEKLWSAVHFPLAEHFEGLAIQHENATRTAA